MSIFALITKLETEFLCHPQYFSDVCIYIRKEIGLWHASPLTCKILQATSFMFMFRTCPYFFQFFSNILHIVRSEIFTAAFMKTTIFWCITLRSPMKVKRCFGGIYRLHLQGRRSILQAEQLCLPPAFTLVSCLAYSSTTKMEATCSFEMSADFQRTT
jgi:hypothetical protein